MTVGKTIRIFLVDGAPSGLLTAEIINWTGSIIVGPRSQLAHLATRDEAYRTGVYCLLGVDPDNPLRDKIYIGEADNVYNRLAREHDKDPEKDFWTRHAAITSKDQNITKAHGRYLESRLISMARAAERSNLSNRTYPSPPPLPESDRADMEYFLEQLQIVFPVLGFHFLLPKPTIPAVVGPSSTSPLFVLQVAGAKATAREVGDEFVVLKGSTARKLGPAAWTSYKSLRDGLVESGKLADSDSPDYFVFTDDVAFSSPSGGAAVVNAGNINGRTAWRVESSGKTYQEWYDEKLPPESEPSTDE